MLDHLLTIPRFPQMLIQTSSRLVYIHGRIAPGQYVALARLHRSKVLGQLIDQSMTRLPNQFWIIGHGDPLPCRGDVR